MFSAVLYVQEDSFANGKTVMEVRKKTDDRMRIDRIERGEQLTLAKLPTVTLAAGDRLYISDTSENLKEFETLLGATLHNIDEQQGRVTEENPLTAPDQQLAELVVTEESPLNDNTLKHTRYAEFFNVIILALHRGSRRQPVPQAEVGDVVLRVGDVLLVQGSKEAIAAMRTNSRLLVLDQTIDLPHTRRAPLALLIMAGVVGLAVAKVLPISVSALIGVLVMLLTRCLSWEDVGASLNTKVVMLVASSLALGSALTRTGGTDYIAQVFLVLAQSLTPEMLLGVLMLLMALMTNFVSNNAAAAIGTPIAVSIAHNLGVSPEPFVLAILFGANLCYATPMAYQTNLLVMSAGGYQFSDFVRVGVPLTILMLTLYTLLLPRFFPL
jgi:di/tricarboxylate transporter